MYQMLMFFMLTDPRTTVSTRSGRIVVVVLIALLECVLRLGNDHHQAWAAPFATAPAIFALAFVGPLAMVLDLRRRSTRA
jgi:enediyne biosynthesis protein E5